ncbi:23 kDa integral membrane protein [Scaptodrosophila lebanonensis]|uniref:Tetraspanin n=1 Tax=Drosophila lebanonensis TaxID=7225 RepID=A0A6J2UFM6_DROLE|nr:23 kDa integral membrane protein [Scaptodrosophila lebanonensis]XP_030387234.1 23 kDa integral membrane protein [Scaptodrosophila lebanonensis]
MASTSCLKVFVYALDIICTLLALVLISFGIYVVVSYDVNDVGSIGAYGYIGLGVSALVVILWGYLSAWRENVCCTVTFIVIIFIIIIAQILVLVTFTKGHGPISSNLANAVDLAWEEELNSPGAMSLYENWFSCCGRASPQDYIVNERLPPDTCFRDHDTSKADNLIHAGCRVMFEDYWFHLLGIFNIVGWVLVGLEIILSVISCLLCNSMRNDHRRSYF